MQRKNQNIKAFGGFVGVIRRVFCKCLRGKKGGFTLIEVLVTVLIIGILTSVALPQYQKAVVKARFAQAKIAANALAQAEEVYYSTHMEYTPVLDNLDVSVDVTSYPTDCTSESDICVYYTSWGHVLLEKDGRVYARGEDGLSYAVFFEEKGWREGQKLCFAYNEKGKKATINDLSYKICQQDTGSATPETSWTGLTAFLYRK